MKSCCSNCKKGKTCSGANMGPGNRLLRRSIGYGAYGDLPQDKAEEVVISVAILPVLGIPIDMASNQAPAPAPTSAASTNDKIFGIIDRKTLIYTLGAVVVYKLLF